MMMFFIPGVETSVPSGVSTIQIVLLVLGGGGLISALVAVLKLKPDVQTAAVTQAHGAMETMEILNRRLDAECEAWRKRAIAAEERNDELERQVEDLGGSPQRGGP